jgi:hypothetical protein
MDSTAPPAPETAARVAEVAARVGSRVGEELGAPLGREVRESALLLGLTLLVLGVVAALASTTLLLG